ncbi:hypothetical protein IV417_10260 [Alphaproteobacteria bacterium KMM 3653]|uniref:SCP domain-containing protein n=1 Tax=Harenicola maris TaxID=2841044 RepID=A0AAP2CPM6_9RHOB|nr:hypothetical protein [Harenicola maris]
MVTTDALEQYLLELINEERAAEGLPALILELNLNQAAFDHAQWQFETGTFSHTGINGTQPLDRVNASGFDLVGFTPAENLGLETTANDGNYYADVKALHDKLMDSPVHGPNVLSDVSTHVGLSVDLGVMDYTNIDGISGSHYSIMITEVFSATNGVVDLDLPGTNVSDTLIGGTGDDELRGFNGTDHLDGRRGDDILNGGNGADTISGGRGNDTLIGANGNDFLGGGRGDDDITGGNGADTIFGGFGNDTINGSAGFDSIESGLGDDVVRGGNGFDTIKGGQGDDELRGGNGNDSVFGNSGNDFLYGGGGNDIVIGNSGNDTLYGGAGDDWLNGGEGFDALVGGGGADTFVFDGDNSVIIDFDLTEDDLRIHADLLVDATGAAITDMNQVVDEFAQVTTTRVLFDFGDGNYIHLVGLTTTEGLAEVIDVL